MAEFFDIDEKTKGMAFSTDDNIIGLEINPDKNTMFGKLIIRNKKDTAQTAIYEYKADLTEKAAKEIKIELKKLGSEKQDTINLKRLNNGSLVVEQNGKSKIINRENVKKYQSMADNYFMLNEIERRKGHNDLLYMFLLGLTIAKVFKKND